MNRVVLVTGGSRGIGRGISTTLASRGYSVAINYAGNKEAAELTKKQCTEAAMEQTQRFEILQADISSQNDRLELSENIYNTFGRLDGLINNAGIAPLERADLLEMDEKSYNRVMDVNLKAPFFLSQLIAKRWKNEKSIPSSEQNKTIIFISSVSSEMVSINRGEYCISKAGISMTSLLFAARLAGEGIDVFEIRPGIIETDMTAGVKTAYTNKIEAGLVPAARWGLPEDIGKSAAALLSGDFSFSTGSVISVDGGMHISRL